MDTAHTDSSCAFDVHLRMSLMTYRKNEIKVNRLRWDSNPQPPNIVMTPIRSPTRYPLRHGASWKWKSNIINHHWDDVEYMLSIYVQTNNVEKLKINVQQILLCGGNSRGVNNSKNNEYLVPFPKKSQKNPIKPKKNLINPKKIS